MITNKRKRATSILMIMLMTLSIFMVPVKEVDAASPKVKLTGANYPKTISVGKQFTIKGKIKSTTKIKRVEVGIVNASNNKWTKYKYDNKKVKAKTFNLKKAAGKLKFNKLSAGTYYYRIYVHTGKGVKTVMNKKFTVTKPADKTKKTAAAPVQQSKTVVTDKDKVTLVGCNYPSKINFGKTYNIKGTIKCDNIIRRVEIGIIVKATNKWCEYKYENNAVNSKEFNISLADDTLRFSRLPGGTYNYRIYVHTDNGVIIALDEPFTVTSSAVPAKAIEWAKKIAADNTFTYGKGYGGYTRCCICAGKTTEKNHAQFTCMPFLAAAYAHASGSSDLMGDGRHVMHLNDKNFSGTLGKAWFKLGLCKDFTINDLQPGDVIIKWSATDDTGHAWMYGGGDMIIEAVPSDIRVLNTGAANKLKKYGSSEGTPSKNYVMRFRGN